MSWTPTEKEHKDGRKKRHEQGPPIFLELNMEVFINPLMCYRTKQSIMINRINCSWIVIHIVFWTFSNCLSNPNLVLSMMKNMSLLSLKKSVTSGSLNLTCMNKFKLVGSRINWHNLSSLWQISTNFISILSLSTAIPLQVEMTWLTVSSDWQILQCGDPPDYSDLIW